MNTNSSKIQVGGIHSHILRKPIKNLHVSVLPPDGKVRVSVPIETKDDTIRMLIASKINWIKKKQQQYRQQERQTKRNFISGETHYFKGRPYLLRINYHKAKPKIIIRSKKYIDLCVKKSSTQEYKQKAIFNWYREELKKQIPKLLSKWEKKTGIEVREWRIRRMKTKWGTCNRKEKRVWLNLELAKKPQSCVEYILLHEMVHILEKNHTETFIKIMNEFMPKWKFYREELNRFILNHEDWNY